jgi:SAM-dependent MidA family methyltransferase
MKASPEERPFAERLGRMIDAGGPIPVARYMAEANAHYYATRDPFGAGGDFTTAPEISQMFGELIGLWLADLWARAGKPERVRYLELGPGRGTLAVDALRAMRSAGLRPEVEFVEASPVLRKAQRERLPGARWHDDLSTITEAGPPLLIVANEFFDALPARQLVATESGWRELLVRHDAGRFLPVAGPSVGSEAIPARLRSAPPGAVIEASPASVSIVRQLAQLIARSGGAVLIADYGHDRSGVGDTLQAVARHEYADPWWQPGERDLTVHVDFEALGAAARAEGVRVLGPRPQGEWLDSMGISVRAEALAGTAPERREEIAEAHRRLTAPDQMGILFKTLALVAATWPEPAGFQ